MLEFLIFEEKDVNTRFFGSVARVVALYILYANKISVLYPEI